MADYTLAPCVEGELDEIWKYISRDNPEAATRVVRAAFETFTLLATNPGLGRPYSWRIKSMESVRSRPVLGFNRYIVLYREDSDGIEIIHVYHVARNISALMRKRR